MKNLAVYLEDLENRIDEQVEEDLTRQWVDFVEGKATGAFRPRRNKTAPTTVDWPHVMVNDTLDDVDRMVLQQLSLCSDALTKGKGELLSVRCNYGTGIIPSLFGAELFIMPYETDTLPASKNLPEGKEAIRRLVAEGVPSVKQGLGEKVFRVAEIFLEIKEQYPKLGKYLHIYPPDTQGPMAVSQSLWGSELYLDFYQEPDLVHQMLHLATETFITFAKHWFELVPPFSDDYCVNWGMLHRGHALIRDDDAMNLSAEMFEEFIRPYDQRILDEFGGGVIHFCGRGDHYVHILNKMAGVHAVNLSQPECNNMDIIYRETIEKGIKIIGLGEEEVARAQAQGIDFRGLVHAGASLAAWKEETEQ